MTVSTGISGVSVNRSFGMAAEERSLLDLDVERKVLLVRKFLRRIRTQCVDQGSKAMPEGAEEVIEFLIDQQSVERSENS